MKGERERQAVENSVEIKIPPWIVLPGTICRATTRRGILGNGLAKNSQLSPLRTIEISEENPFISEPNKVGSLSKYNRRDGSLTIYSTNFYKLAGYLLYTAKSIGGELLAPKLEGPNWIYEGIDQLKKTGFLKIDELPRTQESIYRLWEWLVTYRIIHQAARTHLSLNESLYKELGIENVTVPATGDLAVLIAELISTLPFGIGYIMLPISSIIDGQISSRLRRKIARIEESLLIKLAQEGPLIRLQTSPYQPPGPIPTPGVEQVET